MNELPEDSDPPLDEPAVREPEAGENNLKCSICLNPQQRNVGIFFAGFV